MKHSIIVILLIFNTFEMVFSQLPKRFKEVTIEDFSYSTSFENQQSVILQEQVNYYFDEWQGELRLFTEIIRRLQVGSNFDDYKVLKINYFGKRNFEQIAQFQAFVYNLEGNSIKTTKIKTKNRKNLKLSEEMYQIYAELENVKPGSIIEYRYTIVSLNMVVPQTWYFQHKEPCLYSGANFIIPNFFGYQIKINDSTKLKKNTKSATYTNINFYYKYTDPIPSGINYRSRSFSTNINLSLQSTEYNFVMTNIEPIADENYIDNPNNYAKQINSNLVYIDNKTGLVRWYEQFAWRDITQNIYKACTDNFPVAEYSPNSYEINNAGFIVYRVKDWQAFDAQIMREKMFGMQLIKYLPVKPIIDSLFESNNLSDLQKAEKIYNYITKNFKWNGQYSVFMSDDIDRIFNSKSGNSSDLNFVLHKFMEVAGLNSSIVVIKTVDNGKIDYDWASPTQFNHSIVVVNIDEKQYFFDVTNKQKKWYWLNEQNLNGQGRQISKNNTKFIDILPNVNSVLYRELTISSYQNTCKCNFYEKLSGIFAQQSVNSNFQNITDFQNSFVNIEKFTVTQKNMIDDTLSTFACNFESTDFLENNKIYPFAIVELISYINNQYRQKPLYIKYPNTYYYKITILKDKEKKLIKKFQDFEITNSSSSIVLKTNEDNEKFILTLKIGIYNYFYPFEDYYQLVDIHSKLIEVLDYYLETD